LIQSSLSCSVAAAVTEFINANGLSVYNEETGKGLVRHVFCRQAYHLNGAVACIIAAGGFGSKTQQFVEHMRNRCPELTGIVLNVNKSKGNTVLCGDFHVLWGCENIHDTLCSLQYEISPQAFFQINPAQAEKLYEKAIEYAFEHKPKLAFDLYCGAGTISLRMAKEAERVIGCEIVPEAIENAKKNALANNIDNVEFICADAGEAAQQLAERGLRPEVIVVDPPRKGMDEAAVKAAASMQPDRIVYVSCDCATLSRDILRFNEFGYSLEKVTAVDMFPRTSHVESVAMLIKK
ncbi:MAG: 23S rRNA (uracil(1939)-C(5))-methyltransferase RlmD, partial [Oscillospiraceae bacterium]|nr:23S rRNA (uracil(1939)-C(5))-methyltransferase RlmD [Oscillospiraceae bacterium]